LPQLHRVRWAVRFTLVLGVAASVAANVLHAQPDPVAQIIAAWPPLALLLTVELISRVPVDRRLLAAARLAATTAIAAIAAWVSYWHMAGVAARYGEHGASPYLLPLSVDGLVIVASVSLVELAGRLRTTHPALAARPDRGDAGAAAAPKEAAPTAAVARATQTLPTGPRGDAHAAGPPQPRHDADRTGAATETGTPAAAAASQPPPAQPTPDSRHPDQPEPDAAASREHAHLPPPRDTAAREDPPAQPRAAVAYWRTKDPTLRPAQIATKVGRSERTVRRILADLTDDVVTTSSPQFSRG